MALIQTTLGSVEFVQGTLNAYLATDIAIVVVNPEVQKIADQVVEQRNNPASP